MPAIGELRNLFSGAAHEYFSQLVIGLADWNNKADQDSIALRLHVLTFEL